MQYYEHEVNVYGLLLTIFLNFANIYYSFLCVGIKISPNQLYFSR